MIEVRKLSKQYTSRREGVITAVKEVSFCCYPGEIFGLLGPNGAGKTTTLRMLSTLLRPTSGEAFLDQSPLSGPPLPILRKIGFLTAGTDLYRRLTVRESLEFFGQLHGLSGPDLKSRLQLLSDRLQLKDFIDRRTDKLSTGMKQRASLARVILHDPPVLILDEPTNGLDLLSVRTILTFLEECRKEGKTILFSSHNLAEVEKLCQRAAILNRGSIGLCGTLEEIRSRHPSGQFEEAVFTVYAEEEK